MESLEGYLEFRGGVCFNSLRCGRDPQPSKDDGTTQLLNSAECGHVAVYSGQEKTQARGLFCFDFAGDRKSVV